MRARHFRSICTRAIAPPLRLLTLLTVFGVVPAALFGCLSLTPEQAAEARAALEAAQTRVDQLEQGLDEAREIAGSIDARFAEAVAEQDEARARIETLELQISEAASAGRTDEIQQLRDQIAELRPIADAAGLDSLRAASSEVAEFIDDHEEELDRLLVTVRQLDASLVSPSGEIDWSGFLAAASPAASAIPGYGTAIASVLAAVGFALDSRKKRQQRDTAVTTARRVARASRDNVLAIDQARQSNSSSWESLAPSIKAAQSNEARELVAWAKGKNTDRELDALLESSSRSQYQ